MLAPRPRQSRHVTLRLLNPEPENVAPAVGEDRQREIHGLAADHAVLAHFDPECIEEHDGIDALERPRLPRGSLLDDRVRA